MKGSPKLLDLINPLEREQYCCINVKREEQEEEDLREEKKLELSLGPPGGEWTITGNNNTDHSSDNRINLCADHHNPALKSSPWQTRADHKYLHIPPVMKESSQTCTINNTAAAATVNSTAIPNTKRTAPASVVGWPPIRSFRKNLPSGSSSKPALASPNLLSSQKPVQNCPKGLFVKINMDGIPIGRKVDLKTCNGYEKLSYAVNELFRDLLAAQSDSSAGGMKEKEERGKSASGLLDGSGEYTLVYEDNEGDRMLVGDVPWHMFISTVKRLRVLKSSDLRTMLRGSKQGKAPA